MGILAVLIPVACCVAIPAVIALAVYLISGKRKKTQDSPERLEGVQQGILREEQGE